MMWKQWNVGLERLHQLKQLWRNLSRVLPKVSRPTQAEIDADEYDGSVSIAQWLARDSHRLDSRDHGRPVEMSALAPCITGCFSSSLMSVGGG